MQELALRDREYLAKPFRGRDLLERVHACLGSADGGADRRAATRR
jgi:DNA-binding response OmpR family regulator